MALPVPEASSDLAVDKDASITSSSVQSAIQSRSGLEDGPPASNVDEAWKFLNEHRHAAEGDVATDLPALRRKIDWHIVPLMFCCYTLQFLDKVILNVCSVG